MHATFHGCEYNVHIMGKRFGCVIYIYFLNVVKHTFNMCNIMSSIYIMYNIINITVTSKWKCNINYIDDIKRLILKQDLTINPGTYDTDLNIEGQNINIGYHSSYSIIKHY